METLYTEGVAIHGGPESCVGDPRGRSEALTGVHVGRAIEPRNAYFGVLTPLTRRKATLLRRYREPLAGPARSENQGGLFTEELSLERR